LQLISEVDFQKCVEEKKDISKALYIIAGKVLKKCKHHFINDEEKEDLIQDMVIRAVRNRNKYSKTKGSAFNFFWTVLLSEYKDYVRKLQRRTKKAVFILCEEVETDIDEPVQAKNRRTYTYSQLINLLRHKILSEHESITSWAKSYKERTDCSYSINTLRQSLTKSVFRKKVIDEIYARFGFRIIERNVLEVM
jgi:DNA-directed RNA polymerase specialized sigma24 family protein